jgi:peptide/nickel transport system ATP-binding protein
MPDQRILKIEKLVVSFQMRGGSVEAVSNISFHLDKGETLGIVGESGSGKSVTALSVMNLIPCPPGKISSGKILFNENSGEVNLLALTEKELQKYRGNRIGMIFQEPMTSLNPVYSCGKQISEVLILHQKLSPKEAKLRTIELFKEVKLPRPENIYDSYPHQISGGQKQRVMIAMAISCNPDILIADEPTTALDVTVQKSILELLKSLQQKHGMSIIFITHDLGVVAEIADRVLVMYKGEIVEEGAVKNLFTKPQHPYTKGLIACRPNTEVKLHRLPTIADFMNSEQEYSVDEFILKNRFNELTDHSQIDFDNPILKIEKLKTHFPINNSLFGKAKSWVKAVDDVSLSVNTGETLGLVGESGCGKTTLGRSILFLTQPSSGTVLFKGDNLGEMTSKQLRESRKKIQIIFQDPYSSLNPRKMVGEAIMEPMKVHQILKTEKERKEKTIQLLEKTDLPADYFYRYPHELSGGQRQRICIARALALNPEFIICDESVSALDVSIQAQILNLLNDLKREFNLTYIFISHDLSVVKFMSDRMAVMKDGKILELDTADQIYNHPQTTYTKKLIEAIPKVNF